MEIRKKKILSLAFIALLLLVAVLALCYPSYSANAAAYDPGSIIDYNAPTAFTVVMDANGAGNNAYYSEDNKALIEANNSNTKSYRMRNIDVSAFFTEDSDKNTYKIRSQDDIYNFSSEYFDVVAGGYDTANDYYNTLAFTAKKSTQPYEAQTDLAPRIAVVLKDSSGSLQKVFYVQVTVTAFKPKTTNTATEPLYVQGSVNSVSGKVEPIILYNYTQQEIDLESYLKDKYVYNSQPVNPEELPESVYDRPSLSYNGAPATALKGTKDSAYIEDDDYLYFNDLSEFTIEGNTAISLMPFGSSASAFSFYAGEKVKHSFIVNVNITETMANDEFAADPATGKFWFKDGAGFALTVTLTHRSGNSSNSVKLCLPVVYEPHDKPKMRDTFVMDVSLNASSPNHFEPDTDVVSLVTGNKSSQGFSSVRIFPSFLCDFPTYAGGSMDFNPNNLPDMQNVNSVTLEPEMVNEKLAIKITAYQKGEDEIVFPIYYRSYNPETNSYTSDQISIHVTFSVYGDYSVVLNVNGTKNVRFTINSAPFKQAGLVRDGYKIVSAKSVNQDTEDKTDYAMVQCENGVITVSPQKNAGENKTGILVTMVNMHGKRIELYCPMTINLKAGDFFSGWRLWQVILFWIGIGLGAALVILLIVWLFLRSMHKRKIDELETSAPTSAYIIKLNSTIAAAQAQQKLASQPYGAAPIGAPTQMLQLGAGPTATQAPDPNTLAIGIAPTQSMQPPPQTSYTSTSYAPPPPPPPSMSTGLTADLPPLEDDIYIPISDAELLQRIYEEKFEPRGMLKRTFDKSKDLQAKELEREKERIRADVRSGMSIEEACKSLKQREAEANGVMSTGKDSAPQEPQVDPLIAALEFDPNDPIVTDVSKQEIAEDSTEEQKKLAEAEFNASRVNAEMDILIQRINAIESAVAKTQTDIENANTAIEELSVSIKDAEQKLDDKNTDLAVERRKSAKEAINKEIQELEAKIKADKDSLNARKNDIEGGNDLIKRLQEVAAEYAGKREATEALVAASNAELEAARDANKQAEERAERARKQAVLNTQLETLNPMLLQVNTLNDEIIAISDSLVESAAKKDACKSTISALQNEMLSTTDSAKITEISNRIKDINKEISDIERGVTSNTTLKTNKNIELSSARRKANEFIEKEEIEVNDVIAAEDAVIGQIALDKMLKSTEEQKNSAEAEVARWQEELDTLTQNLDASVMNAASENAAKVKAAEEKLAEATEKLQGANASLETVADDEEKLNLTMLQMSLQEEVETLTAELESMKAEGIKSNLEFRTRGEAEIENARNEYAKAKENFEAATARFHEVSTSINPLDLISSGSGLISQDRKRIEAENLKKILEEQKNAIEAAKLQAQIAQQEAEKAVADAKRASDESKAEAERLAQEALMKAEAAREEAEQKAREESERVRQEAQAEIERARQEAEESRRMAEEEAERAKKAAEEESERLRLEMEESRRLAEEQAEQARKAAEEETERLRKQAEEQAESARLAAAEAEKAKAEEEAKKAEEEAKKAEEEAKRKAIINEKVTKRKAEIAELRNQIKNITEEEQGQELREKFYAIQLALDEDEKSSTELNDLLNKSMDDASHAAELSRYKKLANKKPRTVLKKVTERVNRIPKRNGSAHPGARPAGARPSSAVRPGARPTGARPSSAARPGVRPAGARPGAPRPGARPAGARPNGTRPNGPRPNGRPNQK